MNVTVTPHDRFMIYGDIWQQLYTGLKPGFMVEIWVDYTYLQLVLMSIRLRKRPAGSWCKLRGKGRSILGRGG
jgi:hypothetical protein